MAITLGQICNAIETTLAAATGMNRTESYDEITEGINAGDCPLMQVYWESIVIDPSGDTDRTSFSGAIRHKSIVIHVDIYASQRGNITDDMKRVVDIVDAMLDVFEVQNTKPYFGLTGIQAWHLDSATRTLFSYAGTNIAFAGARFILTITVF